MNCVQYYYIDIKFLKHANGIVACGRIHTLRRHIAEYLKVSYHDVCNLLSNRFQSKTS